MSLPEYFEFQDRTKIIYGQNTLNQVGAEAQKLGATKAAIIADPIIQKLGITEKIEKSLTSSNIQTVYIFSNVPQDSDAKIVTQCYEESAANRADIIIAIGGGSTIDTAKGVNILLTEGGALLEDHQGAYTLPKPLNPMIAIPTTAGTGSEVTFAAVIADKTQHLKITFVSPYLAPTVAILDPEVTISMPPTVTASTAMDALTHGVEAMHSISREPIADAFAIHSIKLINENVREVVKNGSNVDARGKMLIASTIAGLAFSNALVGCVHGIAHSVGGVCGVPHGIANSILLPFGMEYNIEYCPEQYSEVARAMGINISELPAIEAARKAVEAIRTLTKDIGMPQKLREVTVSEEDLPKIAETTMGDGAVYNNPREVIEEEILELLRRAY